MKTYIKLAICAGIIFPLVSSAQLINVTNEGGTFFNLVSDMNSDFSPELEIPGYTTVAYDIDNADFVTDPTVAELGSLSANTIIFNEINPNVDFFTVYEWAKVGFIGNENGMQNQLSVRSYTDATLTTAVDNVQLFDYDINGNPTPPPAARRIANTDADPFNNPVVIQFEHTNPTTLTTTQSNMLRFKIFQGTGADSNKYLLGIDDLETDKVDFDDGVFYLEVSPIPEPSQIAALSVLGLGLLLVVRRRMKSKK
jgi:hypothetical protein